MDCKMEWPEPIVRVQSLSERGLAAIPTRYIKPPADRPSLTSGKLDGGVNIPLIDFEPLLAPGAPAAAKAEVLAQVSEACRSWGFFQAVNHGVPPELMDEAREIWRQFFHQPMEVKQPYANSPKTYEGYGSRLGVEKGAVLDWSDYYFLHYLPCSLKDHNKWPALPSSLRYVTCCTFHTILTSILFKVTPRATHNLLLDSKPRALTDSQNLC